MRKMARGKVNNVRLKNGSTAERSKPQANLTRGDPDCPKKKIETNITWISRRTCFLADICIGETIGLVWSNPGDTERGTLRCRQLKRPRDHGLYFEAKYCSIASHHISCFGELFADVHVRG